MQNRFNIKDSALVHPKLDQRRICDEMYPPEKGNYHCFEHKQHFSRWQLKNTFTFGYTCLTLTKDPNIKSEHIRRFLAHEFL